MTMKEQVDGLKKSGMIESSSSPWASRLVMVTEKDGSIRVCVDFREVKELCQRDAYPAPQIEQTLDQLRSAKWFTSLDAEKGYHQVQMTDRTIAREVTQTLDQPRSAKWFTKLDAEKGYYQVKMTDRAIAREVTLNHPDFAKPFLLVTDASDRGVGAMLAQLDEFQRERPIAFASGELRQAQKNYSATHKEGLAVVWAVEHFKPYIHGMPTVVVTDHSALTWILTNKEPSQRLARWTMTLMEYDLHIIHRKGKYNAIADALSRLPTEHPPNLIDLTTEDTLTPISIFAARKRRRRTRQGPASEEREEPEVVAETMDREELEGWRQAQKEDKLCSQVIKYLGEGLLPEKDSDQGWVRSHGHEFVIQQGLVCKVVMTRTGRFTTASTKIVVPAPEVTKLVMSHHETIGEGAHQGTRRTYIRLAQHYWWPRMFSDIRDTVVACEVCQITGKGASGQATIGGSLVGSSPFEVVAMDLMAMPVSWSGNKYLMVVEDYLSNYVIVAPLADKTAETIAEVFLKQVVLVYGPPAVVHSDRGSEFRNKVMTELCTMIEAKKIFTTPYHPQADGKVERFNRTIQRMLACYVSADQKNWDVILPYILYAYNTTTSRKHGRSPFNIIYGRDPKNPFILNLLEGSTTLPKDPSSHWLRHAEEHSEFIKEVVSKMDQEAREDSHEYTNLSRKAPPIYKPGTLILIKSFMKQMDGAKPKLQKKYRGPFVVLKMTSPVTVWFRPVAGQAEADSAHVDNTKAFVSTKGKEVVLTSYVGAPSSLEEEEVNEVSETEEQAPEESWVVERVMDYKLTKGAMQFLVRWKGFTADEDSWIPEGDMSCHHLVEEFFRAKGSF
jgi:hypothetical protein